MQRQFVVVDHNALSPEGHHRMYSSSVALAAHRSGHDVTVIWNKRLPLESVPAPYRMTHAFSHTESEAAARGILPFGEGHYGYELDGALRPLALRADAVVFVHTLHFVELVELLEYLSDGLPRDDMPSFHVVVRYDPERFQPRIAMLRRSLATIEQTPVFRRKIHFHSDTRRLADDLQKLFSTPFGVCPIPLHQEHLLPALAATPARADGAPLTITYLGAARTEKGYRDILGALDHLRAYLASGEARLVLQCSHNSLRFEPGLYEYQENLERYIAAHGLEPSVRLVKEVVETEAYHALLAQSDIVLIGYSPVDYHRRSSGVLMEAMAAGKVVVTTAGSWMATRVSPANAVVYDVPAGLGPAIAEAIDRFAYLQAGARALQPTILEETKPESLVRYLAEAGRSPATAETATPERRRILVVADAETILQRDGAARLLMSRISGFLADGYGVVAVLACRDDLGRGADRRRALSRLLGRHAFESIYLIDPDRPTTTTGQGFGSPGDLTADLRESPPDAAYIPSVSLLPIVRALGIDDARLIFEARGFLTETAADALTRLDEARPQFIACSASEAKAVAARTPGAAVVERPPFQRGPLDSSALAGPRDGLELVMSARAPLLRFQLAAAPAEEERAALTGLASLSSIDLLFLGSETEDAEAGLRWLLNEVYGPFLSGRQASLIVAGGVKARGPFPAFPFVFFVDRTDFLEPLLAAAKVILASTASALVTPIEFNEALASDKPIVARTAPGGGGGPLPPGVEVYNDPRAFADAVLGLLDSPARRRCSRRGDDAPESGRPVEWTPEIATANQLMRNLLSNGPFGGFARCHDVVVATAEYFVKYLLENQTAPFLRVDLRTAEIFSGARRVFQPEEISELCRLLQDPPPPREARRAGDSETILVHRRLSGFVCARGVDGGGLKARLNAEPLSSCENHDEARLSWSFEADPDEGPELDLLRLHGVAELHQWSVRQQIPLDESLRLLGHKVFAGWSFDPPAPPGRARLFVRSQKALNGIRAAKAPLTPLFSLKSRSRLHKWAPWAKANPLFDAAWYAERYPDITASAGALFRHYNRRGASEGYDPSPFFNTAWYLDQYPEVRASRQNPLDHYYEIGGFEGYDPCPGFSSSAYLDDNPDVRAWRINPLAHFLKFGRVEGRRVRPAEVSAVAQTMFLPVPKGIGGESWFEMEVALRPESAPVQHLRIWCGERLMDAEIVPSAAGSTVRCVLHPSGNLGVGPFGLSMSLTEDSKDEALEIVHLAVGWTKA